MESTSSTAVSPDDKWALYSAALTGPRHDYYLARFKRIESGKWLSWNWAAMLFTFCWLRYRRMYGYSWAYLPVSAPALAIVLVMLARGDPCAAELEGGSVGPGTGLLVLLIMQLANLLAPLFADRIYFRFLTRRIAAARRSAPDEQAATQILRGEGATGGYWGALGFMLGLMFVVAAAVPNYSGYPARARFSELVVAGAVYRVSLEEFFSKHQRMPTAMEEIGEPFAPSHNVKAVTLGKDGTIKVVAGFTPADGRSVLFSPSVRDGRIAWTCHSDDIPARCLPANCRPRDANSGAGR